MNLFLIIGIAKRNKKIAVYGIQGNNRGKYNDAVLFIKFKSVLMASRVTFSQDSRHEKGISILR